MVLALSAWRGIGGAQARGPTAVLTGPITEFSYFGFSVAGANRTAIVGAPHRLRDDDHVQVGEAYVLDTVTGALRQTLPNPRNTFDGFGIAVAVLSSRVVAVGAPGPSVGGNVHFFDVTTGALTRTVPAPPGAGAFGSILAFDGRRLLVGGMQSVAPQDLRGAVFVVDGRSGEITQTITGEGPFTDGFGAALAVRRGEVVVGAPGIGRVYLLDAKSGALLEHIDDPAGGLIAGFGSAVAVTVDRIFASTPNDSVVHVFDKRTGAFIRSIRPSNGTTGSTFGTTLAAIGRDVLIGQAETSTFGTGSAYVYGGRSGELLNTFEAPPAVTAVQFGNPVATAGNRVMVAAPNLLAGPATVPADYGAVYVFPRRAR